MRIQPTFNQDLTKFNAHQPTFIPKLRRCSITVENFLEDVSKGMQTKEIAHKHGISLVLLANFVKENKLNYKELRKQARKKIIETAENAEEVSKILGIDLLYARKLVAKYKYLKPSAVYNREKRLQSELPLFENGKNFSFIARKIGICRDTVRSDIEFYLTNIKGSML